MGNEPFRVITDLSSNEEVIQKLRLYFNAPDNPEVDPKEVNAEEVLSLNNIKLRYQEEQLKRLRSDNENRRSFSNAIFTVTVLWMFLVLVIVIEAGRMQLKLSDTVLVALVTTTTANVFGFFYVVVNYLFNKEKST